MAQPDYANFVAQVLAANSDFDCTSHSYCVINEKCKKVEKDLKDLKFLIDDTDYTVPPYGYLIEGYNGANCSIAVSYLGILQDSYVLGDTFIKNFYASFNYENKTVGLAVNAEGPTTYLPVLPWGAWLGIGLGGVLLIAGVILGICYYKGRGKPSGQKLTSDALLGEETDEMLRKTNPEIRISEAESDLLNVKVAHDTLVEE